MEKKDLILELTTSQESAYNIFLKGYLHSFPMDEDIYQALLPKLTTEANELGAQLELFNLLPSSFSQAQLDELSTKTTNLELLVFNVCSSHLSKETYFGECITQLQSKLRPSFVSQYQAVQNQGYEVIADANVLKIIDMAGQLTYQSAYTPMKEILKEWGINTTHPQYYLFYFTQIPPEDLETYRKIHLMSNFFKFV